MGPSALLSQQLSPHTRPYLPFQALLRTRAQNLQHPSHRWTSPATMDKCTLFYPLSSQWPHLRGETWPIPSLVWGTSVYKASGGPKTGKTEGHCDFRTMTGFFTKFESRHGNLGTGETGLLGIFPCDGEERAGLFWTTNRQKKGE